MQTQALNNAVLHADETGWRVNGKSHGLWCFTATEGTYYLIDRRRGSPTLKRKELPPERFASRRERLGSRLHDLLAPPWVNRQARRLVKRRRRHKAAWRTLLAPPEVPSDSNHAERPLRPAVMVRTTS